MFGLRLRVWSRNESLLLLKNLGGSRDSKGLQAGTITKPCTHVIHRKGFLSVWLSRRDG